MKKNIRLQFSRRICFAESYHGPVVTDHHYNRLFLYMYYSVQRQCYWARIRPWLLTLHDCINYDVHLLDCFRSNVVSCYEMVTDHTDSVACVNEVWQEPPISDTAVSAIICSGPRCLSVLTSVVPLVPWHLFKSCRNGTKLQRYKICRRSKVCLIDIGQR